MFPAPLLVVIAAALLLLRPANVGAQGIADIPTAFDHLDSFGLGGKNIDCSNAKFPSGGHLQGVGFMRNTTEKLFITASCGKYSYYLVSSFFHFQRRLIASPKLMDEPYRHAGGCQVADDKLFVGIEDNSAKDKSVVMMLSLDEDGKELQRNIIIKRQGVYKRSTAGAVGAVKTKSGQYVVAVGDWDSRNIDFYLSRIGIDTLFDSINTFHAPEERWGSYQSINLFVDSSENIFMIGLCTDEKGNRADLFNVRLDGAAKLQKYGTKYFNPAGFSFRYAAGACIDRGHLCIYVTERNPNHGKLKVHAFYQKSSD